MSWRSKLARFSSSIAVGLSTGASVGMSIFQETKNPIAGVCAFAGASIAEGINWYCFQGKSIEIAFEPQSTPYTNLQAPLRALDIENPSDEKEEKKTCCTAACTASTSAQIVYNLLDATKSFFDRYYVLKSIFTLFSANPASPLFWGLLGSGLFIKQLFNMAHETFETSESIGNAIDNSQDKPWYAKIFNLCHSPMGIKFFRRVGSAEHTINDDLLPWLALLPASALSYWALLLLLPAGVIGYLTYRQTEFFEGKHAEENINKCTGKPIQDDRVISDGESRILRAGLKIMSTVHGVAIGTPVALSTLQLMNGKSNIAKYLTAGAALGTVGVASGLGTQWSEVREAQEELDRIQTRVAPAA